MKGRYDYSDHELREIELMTRKAIPLPRVVLKKSTLEADFGGVDATYTVNGKCAIQLRCRFDRPAYAADIDVSFRETEPAMIRAGTYAPLLLVIWLRDGYAVAGKLIDVYRMAGTIDPPLERREVRPNRRGPTGYMLVDVAELHATRSLLRNGDRDGWTASRLGGNEDTLRIVENGTIHQTSNGAPTDEPPPPAPSDLDDFA
jgi:hypothetical protein